MARTVTKPWLLTLLPISARHLADPPAAAPPGDASQRGRHLGELWGLVLQVGSGWQIPAPQILAARGWGGGSLTPPPTPGSISELALMGNLLQPLLMPHVPKRWRSWGGCWGCIRNRRGGPQDPPAPFPPRHPLHCLHTPPPPPKVSSELGGKPCEGRVPLDENRIKSSCLACQAASRPKDIVT